MVYQFLLSKRAQRLFLGLHRFLRTLPKAFYAIRIICYGGPPLSHEGWFHAPLKIYSRRGRPYNMLRRHMNFGEISHRFTWSFANPSFQDLNGSHIMYWKLYPSGFTVDPTQNTDMFALSCDLLSLRYSENSALFHIEWLCRKTVGNVNRPPYRYITAIHCTWPASFVFEAKIWATFFF